ncbi:MAG: hypothetical protein ACR2IE_01775 [Candidatus Sumerlaeaceae bacterium]
MASETSNAKKAGIAIALILIAGGLAYSRMQKYLPGPEINNGVSSDFEGPSRAEFHELAKKANITPEQQKKIEEAREKGDFRSIMDVLTTDQRQMIGQERSKRRAAQETKMKSALGDDYDKYQQKRQAQRGGWGRGGGGGRGSGDGNRGGGPRS